MRWSDLDVSYARPLQWIVALLGNTVIPFEIAGIVSGNRSAGHAQLCDKTFPIESAGDYVARLEEHKVMVD